MRALHGKLKRLKAELKRFNQIHFGNLMAKMADKKKELMEVQMAVLQGTDCNDLMEKEILLPQELGDLMQAEVSYLL